MYPTHISEREAKPKPEPISQSAGHSCNPYPHIFLPNQHASTSHARNYQDDVCKDFPGRGHQAKQQHQDQASRSCQARPFFLSAAAAAAATTAVFVFPISIGFLHNEKILHHVVFLPLILLVPAEVRELCTRRPSSSHRRPVGAVSRGALPRVDVVSGHQKVPGWHPRLSQTHAQIRHGRRGTLSRLRIDPPSQ